MSKQPEKTQPSPENKTIVIKKMRYRMLITVGLMTIGFCILIISLINISILKHDEYSEIATDQQLRDTVVSAPRGTIYDANMNVLAESAPVWTVALSPMDISEDDYDSISKALSEYLDMDYQKIFDKCSEKNYYSILKRKVDQPVVDEIRAYISENNMNGISFTEDSKRYYPYGNFAAQVLGFVGIDNQGLSGLEAYYDDYLSGTSGRVLSAKNAVGSDMYYEYSTIYEPKQGYSLVLTLDEVIQHYLEKHLETAVKEHNVENKACGIVMNVKTGEILAMSTKPDFDPNDPFTISDAAVLEQLGTLTGDDYLTALGQAQQQQWRNKAVADVYEPGSVFKVVTASTALETGAATLNSSYYCSGSFEVIPGLSMSCAYTAGHGQEDFVNAVINSCNPAFIQIGQSIGIHNFTKYFEAFGLAEKTGIDLPGEAQSIVYNENNMGIVELASCSYGQSNAITPIQMITAVSAAVNGGYLVQPHIVKQVLDSDNSIVQSFDTQIKRQVISSQTSELMSQILEQVVLHANGQNSYVAGFRIGGKSGTSQKLGGAKDEYIASFIGMAPADDPEIAVMIMLDTPRSYSIYGGILAAPVVGSIMSDVLPYIGVDPVYTEEELANLDVITPNVVGKSYTLALSNLQPEGLESVVVGEGTTIVNQFPTGGQSIPRGSRVILYTEETELLTVQVPDVTNMSPSAAAAALKAAGLNIRENGTAGASSMSVSQSVAAGETVNTGTVVEVEFVVGSVAD